MAPTSASRTWGKWMWASLIALAMLAVGIGYRLMLPPVSELYVIAPLPTWELSNQSGEPFGTRELAGQVYLANFIFSRCPSVCPKMLENTAKLQQELAGTEGVKLVTFTVDPSYDTPKVLMALSQRYGADLARWVFLTHPNEAALFQLYSQGFKVSAAPARPATDLYDIAHSEKVVLVDQRGRIRGYYGQEPEKQRQLVIDAVFLAKNGPGDE